MSHGNICRFVAYTLVYYRLQQRDEPTGGKFVYTIFIRTALAVPFFWIFETVCYPLTGLDVYVSRHYFQEETADTLPFGCEVIDRQTLISEYCEECIGRLMDIGCGSITFVCHLLYISGKKALGLYPFVEDFALSFVEILEYGLSEILYMTDDIPALVVCNLLVDI